MDKDEQKKFVRELSETIVSDICGQIDRGSIPEEWDGIELRHLLKYRHHQSALMTKNFKSRIRKMNNVIITNNL